MSLTSFIAIPEIRARFAREFPLPPSRPDGDLLVHPASKRYALIGTAFDYLFRFLLKRINPGAVEHPWVAEAAVEMMGGVVDAKKRTGVATRGVELFLQVDTDDPVARKCKRICAEARGCYDEYLATGKLERSLIESAIKLAQVDAIFRPGYIDPRLGKVYKEDVEDLRRLLGVVDPLKFSARKRCIVNPTFGEASLLVGGADADVLIDETLIEVKTTQHLALTRTYLNQLLGYYVLSKIGCIDGVSCKKRGVIRRLGIYYSRHGVFYSFSASDVVTRAQLSDFVRWFKKRARYYFPSRS